MVESPRNDEELCYDSGEMAAAPDNSALQVFYGAIPLVGAFVLAHMNSIKHWDALNKRIDDLIVSTNSGFSDVNSLN